MTLDQLHVIDTFFKLSGADYVSTEAQHDTLYFQPMNNKEGPLSIEFTDTELETLKKFVPSFHKDTETDSWAVFT